MTEQQHPGEDVEGHGRLRQSDEGSEEDVEGHGRMKLADDDSDDVEGHSPARRPL